MQCLVWSILQRARGWLCRILKGGAAARAGCTTTNWNSLADRRSSARRHRRRWRFTVRIGHGGDRRQHVSTGTRSCLAGAHVERSSERSNPSVAGGLAIESVFDGLLDGPSLGILIAAFELAVDAPMTPANFRHIGGAVIADHGRVTPYATARALALFYVSGKPVRRRA